MGKYTALQSDIYSVFASEEWESELIKTYPTDMVAVNAGTEFIRVNIIADGEGLNLSSVSGILNIDIFVSAGKGPTRANILADTLDAYLVGHSFKLSQTNTTQFRNSAMSFVGRDPDDASLSRYIYSIPFHYFGVL